MDNTDIQLEIDRLENIILNFGWKITSKLITEDDITITITKPITQSMVAASVGPS
jgi:hypothetical protein